MRLKTSPADPRHATWLGKWGDPSSGWTRTLLHERAFDSEEQARAAWPACRRAVWMATHRFAVPRAATVFDG